MHSMSLWGAGNDAGDALTVDLRDLTATLHADAHVDMGELVFAEQEDGFEDLIHSGAQHHAHDGWQLVSNVQQLRIKM